MAKKFTPAQWTKILDLTASRGEEFGLPEQRDDSVVIGAFNIRDFGRADKRSEGSWELLTRIAQRYDLLAVQEVEDSLESIKKLRDAAGDDCGLVVSDISGSYPGASTAAERLAFLFRWSRVRRTEIASDITYDRTRIIETLLENHGAYAQAYVDHMRELGEYEGKKKAGKRPRNKPKPELPTFLTFIRQPTCASFEVIAQGNADPLAFLGVSAHLLYGTNKDEREFEFWALIQWLIDRTKSDNLYAPNLILMGDLNLDFKKVDARRAEIETRLQGLIDAELDDSPAEVNFPFLEVHPDADEVFRTNARSTQTYDHIAFFSTDGSLPSADANSTAGTTEGGYDYGMFDFVDLIARALHDDTPFWDLEKKDRDHIIERVDYDVSDHMPIWVRVPIPGA